MQPVSVSEKQVPWYKHFERHNSPYFIDWGKQLSQVGHLRCSNAQHNPHEQILLYGEMNYESYSWQMLLKIPSSPCKYFDPRSNDEGRWSLSIAFNSSSTVIIL